METIASSSGSAGRSRGAASLTIRQIELVPLLVPLEKEYRGSYYQMSAPATIVTRVHTEEGIVGEAYAGDEEAALHLIHAIIRDESAPRLIGEDALAYERCFELAYPVIYDQLRDKRVSLVAVASVDLAIWDAIGKFLDTPLWRLWGGYRDRIGVNIIGGYYGPDLAGIRKEVTEWKELGYRGCKFKIGGRAPAEDADRVRAAREALGDDFVLTVEANQGYTLAQALEFCDRVRDLGIRWFEELCVWSNDKRDLRDVRACGGIPICAGQSEFSPNACSDLFETGAIDVCNFDASWSGGYTNLETNGGSGGALQRRARPPRGAAGRRAPAREPAARNIHGDLRTGTRPDLVEPDREPTAARGRRVLAAAGPRSRLDAR